MKLFDEDILSEFLSEEGKECFIEWENIVLTESYSSIPNSMDLCFIQCIVANFKRKYQWDSSANISSVDIPNGSEYYNSDRVIIPLDEYESKLKQKLRSNKIDQIL